MSVTTLNKKLGMAYERLQKPYIKVKDDSDSADQRHSAPEGGVSERSKGLSNTVVTNSRELFRLQSDIRNLLTRADKRVIGNTLRQSLDEFQTNFQQYFEGFKRPNDPEAIIRSGLDATIHSEAIGHVFNRFNSLNYENRRIAQLIIKRSRSIHARLTDEKEQFIEGLANYRVEDIPKLERDMRLSELADSNVEMNSGEGLKFDKPLIDPSNSKPDNELKEKESAIKAGQAAKEKQSQLAKELKESRKRIQDLEEKSRKTAESYKNNLIKLSAKNDRAVKQLEVVQKEVLLHESKAEKYDKALSFEDVADQERKQANFYRYVALSYLGIFSAVILYLIIETVRVEFSNPKTVLLTVLSIALLSPIAFIIRESVNHRRQQHEYMHAALHQYRRNKRKQSIMK